MICYDLRLDVDQALSSHAMCLSQPFRRYQTNGRTVIRAFSSSAPRTFVRGELAGGEHVGCFRGEMMAVGDDSDRVTDIEVDERGERWAHYTRVADSRGEYWADSSNDGCSSSSSSSNNSSSSDEADDGQGTAESGRCGPAAAGPVRNGT